MAQHHERYWSQFCDYLEQRGSQLRSNTAKSGHYIDFMIDTNVGFRIRQVIRPQPGEVTIQFFMREDAKKYYPLFCQQKVEIENEFGEKLVWLEEKYGDSRVCLIRTDMKLTKDEANWPEQHEWLASNLEKLYDVFHPRLETITTTL